MYKSHSLIFLNPPPFNSNIVAQPTSALNSHEESDPLMSQNLILSSPLLQPLNPTPIPSNTPQIPQREEGPSRGVAASGDDERQEQDHGRGGRRRRRRASGSTRLQGSVV